MLDPAAMPVVAHRGASGELPENTMLAFREGLAQGADALEFDVRLTADGVPVVMHDATVDRTTGGTGAVSHLELAHLASLDAGHGERVPTVEQVLGEFPETPVIIELKEAQASGPLRDVLRRHNAQSRALVGSFEHRALSPFFGPEFHRAASRREAALFWTGSRLSVGLALGGVAAFTVPSHHRGITVVDRRFVRVARRHGRPVHVWTVDDETEATWLRSIGVAGIITNYPARMRALCAQSHQW